MRHEKPPTADLPRLVATLSKHEACVTRPCWSPDGTMLATPDDAAHIRIWDTRNLGVKHVLVDHEDLGRHSRIYDVAWSPDSTRLAVVADDSILRVWDVAAESIEMSIDVRSRMHSVAWSNDGQYVAVGCRDGVVRVLQSDDLTSHRHLERHSDWVNAVAWSPNGKELLSVGGDSDCTVRMWDVDSSSVLWKRSHFDYVLHCCWSPDAEMVASCSNDGEVKVLNARDGEDIIRLQAHRDMVKAVSFSANSRILASKSRDDTVRLTDVKLKSEIGVIQEPASGRWPAGLAFHPSRLLLATLGVNTSHGRDTAVRIWDVSVLSSGD